MTPRGTDWTLALLVALLFATGVLSLFSGRDGGAWVFVAHGTGGFALGLVVGWKLRRVWRRIAEPRRWDRRTAAGLLATGLVGASLVSGWAWASGGDVWIAGYNLLNWHMAIGVGLTLLVLAHATMRAKPIRRGDLAHRRQFLQAAAITAGAVAIWQLQRPVSALLGSPGAQRRFTGSYEAGSFQANAFPATSWVADSPRVLGPEAYRLEVSGAVSAPLQLALAELEAGDELEATLDCTGGFYSTQRWQGARLGRLVDRARPAPSVRHVRVISRTGYRRSFPLAEARGLLLATAVGDEPLSHAHGAPVRLVAPGRRGFEWVKWVVRLELHEEGDPGALASTVWSSFTPEGRGAA